VTALGLALSHDFIVFFRDEVISALCLLTLLALWLYRKPAR
jgi:hypothetical protein